MNTNIYEHVSFCKEKNTPPYFEDYANREIMPRMKTLADRVRFKMSQLGIKQPRLAKLCGVSQPTINRLLHGETESPLYIYELSRALETSVRWLKTGLEDAAQTERDEAVTVGGYKGASAAYHKTVESMSASEEAADIFKMIVIASPDAQRILEGWIKKGALEKVDIEDQPSRSKPAKSKKNP